MKRENDVIDILQQDIVIPAVVQEKANLAFRQIQSERKANRTKNNHRKWKTIWLPIAAAVLVFGTTVCAAVYVRWSKGLETQLEVTEEQKTVLEETQIAAPVNNSVTKEGITVTAIQTIVDSNFAYLAFQVEGYHTEEGIQPDFEYHTIEIDGKNDYNMLMGHFFDGLQLNNRQFTYLDGTPAKERDDGSVIPRYMDEDGKMEFIMLLMTAREEESFIGKPLHLELHNLGTVSKAAFTPDINATWTFDFTLQGSDQIRACELSETLGDSGATVIEAEISPISLHVVYDMPLQLESIEAINPEGETIQTTTFVEAPKLTGVRLKDGTLLTGIVNGGAEGYAGDDKNHYQARFATQSIIDPAQVDALLFIRNAPMTDAPPTEDDLYIVPIER